MPRKKRRGSSKVSSELEFNHAMVYVRNVAPALHFYGDLLGFKLIEQVQAGGFPSYARLRSPGGRTTLALHKVEPGQILPETDGVRLYFEVKNVESVCKALAAAGVVFQQGPKVMPWGWKHAYLRDPDGHELSLYWAGARRFQRSRAW